MNHNNVTKIGSSSVTENKSVGNKEVVSENNKAGVNDDKQKFAIALMRDEIEEYIFMLTGMKPAHRPKKRQITVQKQLDASSCVTQALYIVQIHVNKWHDQCNKSAVLGKRKRTDQATASIFVAATADNSALQKLPPPTHKSGDATFKIIPRQLHRLIQMALKQRERVMRNKLQRKLKKALKGKNYSESESVSEDKNDSESELYNHLDVQMEQCEDRVRLLAKKFKKLKQLPHDWEYDPVTASTFVAAEADIPALPKMPPPKKKRSTTNKFPKTTDVPLDEEEKKIWMDFKEFDKDNRGLYAVDVNTVDKHKRPLRVANPVVGLTSKFAVTAFNEAIEMYVKKGEQNNIHEFDVVKCDYLKMNETSYYFYISIEAFEERKCGVYDTKVRLNWDDGSKSLMHFILTDRKPRGLKETTKLRTYPDSWQDCSNIPHSGMRRRQNRRSIYRGYDYRTPWGMDSILLSFLLI
ncbi:40S ribosomal protein S13 [Tanacetum coccineum]